MSNEPFDYKNASPMEIDYWVLMTNKFCKELPAGARRWCIADRETRSRRLWEKQSNGDWVFLRSYTREEYYQYCDEQRNLAASSSEGSGTD